VVTRETGSVARHPVEPSGTPVAADLADVPTDVVAPSREDPVVRAASQVVGGPAGRRLASAAGLWRATSILVALSAVMLMLGVVEKQHCREQGWTTPDQFWHACYTDIPVLFGSASLGGPDRATLAEATGPGGLGQPPLASAAMWLVSAVVPDDAQNPARSFFDTSTIVLVLVLAVGVTALALAAGRRRFDAAHLALAPILVTAGLISYQLVAVALLAVALLAWQRERPALAGFFLGLAAASAPPLMLLAVAVAAVLVRQRAGQVRDAVVFGGVGVVSWFAVRALLLPGMTGALGEAWRNWRDAPPGYGSLWLVPQLLGASAPRRDRWWWPFGGVSAMSGSTASALSLIATIGFVAVVTIVVLRRPRPVPFPRVALALAAGTLVLGTSLPVQASLLLLPLVALSGLLWRDHLIWATTEVVYFVAVWLYIAAQSDPNRGLPAGFYLAFLVARLAGISWLGWQALMSPAPDGIEGEPVDNNRFAPDLWTVSVTPPDAR
jgi:hypothetical protein